MTPPKIFVSYAWESEAHKLWVKSLAWSLRDDGVDAILDQWETAPGDQLPEFMEASIRTSNFVLIVCTPKYKAKSDSRRGGVGYEGDVMTSEAFTGVSRRKFVPVLAPDGTWDSSAPSWLKGSFYLDLSNFPEKRDGYIDLLQTVHSRRESAPPVKRNHNGDTSSAVMELHRSESSVQPASENPHPLHMGSEWTEDLETNAEWPRVWQTLVAREPTPDILALGRWWLEEREDREEWPQVWQTLVAREPTPDILALGRWWLERHEDREEWHSVWQTLVAREPTPDILALGRWWLERHENR